MSILIRLLANLACILGIVWLLCQSIPLVALAMTRMSGGVQVATIAIAVGLDVLVGIFLLVIVNMYLSETGQ